MKNNANEIARKRLENTEKFKYPEDKVGKVDLDLSMFKKLSYKLLDLK
jgi:hypothetical protein